MISAYKIIVAIDGSSSTGKSTLAKALALKLGYGYVDTGAMYRATTLFLIRHNMDFNNIAAIQKALYAIQIQFRPGKNGNRTFLNGEDVEDEIRTMPVSEKVSEVAAVPLIRRAMVAQQQAMAKERGFVMDGRDIGTVVFKDAELKLFLTADQNVRLKRRYDELIARGIEISEEDVLANLLHRDHIDSTREDSPLRKASDAIELDNTNLTQEEQLEIAYQYAMERIKQTA